MLCYINFEIFSLIQTKIRKTMINCTETISLGVKKEDEKINFSKVPFFKDHFDRRKNGLRFKNEEYGFDFDSIWDESYFNIFGPHNNLKIIEFV